MWYISKNHRLLLNHCCIKHSTMLSTYDSNRLNLGNILIRKLNNIYKKSSIPYSIDHNMICKKNNRIHNLLCIDCMYYNPPNSIDIHHDLYKAYIEFSNKLHNYQHTLYISTNHHHKKCSIRLSIHNINLHLIQNLSCKYSKYLKYFLDINHNFQQYNYDRHLLNSKYSQ